jgi:hypothetical protein
MNTFCIIKAYIESKKSSAESFIHLVSKKLKSIGLKSDVIHKIILFVEYVDLSSCDVDLCCRRNTTDKIIVTIINNLLLCLFKYPKMNEAKYNRFIKCYRFIDYLYKKYELDKPDEVTICESES